MTQKVVENGFVRIFLIISGFISLLLGILGIFLPLLPTSPFVVLSAYLFGKSSDRFHFWLINNKIFGNYIKTYQEGKGMSRRSKTKALSSMWTVLFISAIWGTDLLFARIILGVVGASVTIYLLRIPTYNESKLKSKLNEE